MTTILAPVSQPKLRVTILGLNYSPEPSGNAPYTTSLAEGLVRAGHQVRVLTGYPHYPEWRLREGYSGWSSSELINGVEVVRLQHYIPNAPSTLRRLHMELSFGLRLIFAPWGRPDVVLAVSPALFASGLGLAKARLLRKRPATGIWIQDIYSRGIVETGAGSPVAARLAAKVEGSILRSADGVVAIHERFRQFIVESLHMPSRRVSVIRNWTHLPPAPVINVAESRSRLGWAPDDIVVLHAGNMGKKQGLENVVEAAKRAEKSGSRVRFVLMGDGNQRQQLESMARGVGRLQFIDPLPGAQFQEALSAADILLVNELSGVKDMAVPSKLTSYFNAGRPVLAATDIGSVTSAEIQASGGGLRVDAADPGALVSAAEALGSDPNLSKRFGDKGLNFRYETLSEGAAINHYDEFITSLALSRDQ
jgi:colanic acid biosynthesis glycosyl transferase WcaI